MLTATVLAVFYIPLFYVLVRRGVRDGVVISAISSPPPRGAGMKRSTALLALLATGCTTMEPAYVRPDPAIPASWPAGDPYLLQAEAGLPVADLRAGVPDPRLQTLVAQALANNRDLMSPRQTSRRRASNIASSAPTSCRRSTPTAGSRHRGDKDKNVSAD